MISRTSVLGYLSMLLIAAAVWFLGPPALRYGIGFATDKFYDPREVCDSNFGCVTIVSESKLALDSYVKSYFFIGRWFKLPIVNHNYVMFEDGADFCFVHSGDGRYKIYSTMEPVVNNLGAYVEVHPLSESPGLCQY
ncbi:hypothetical protein [Mesorhizobium sp. IMUNJ 23232]|uniref:hypothetical protein n=1 Tax=Mesorhizobium sp. IMUNJ 23232 TaxID=3376064 RepID=UPI0037B0CF3F